jgi:hypothetical protein
LKVSIAAGQKQYVAVTLRHSGGVSPRCGGLTSDQTFDLRLVQPEYGVRRAHEYRLFQADCQTSMGERR